MASSIAGRGQKRETTAILSCYSKVGEGGSFPPTPTIAALDLADNTDEGMGPKAGSPNVEPVNDVNSGVTAVAAKSQRDPFGKAIPNVGYIERDGFGKRIRVN